MGNTTVIVGGQTPGGRSPAMVREQPGDEPGTGRCRSRRDTQHGNAPTGLWPQQRAAVLRASRPTVSAITRSRATPSPITGQSYYGQPAYGQPYYGQPVYRQW